MGAEIKSSRKRGKALKGEWNRERDKPEASRCPGR